MIVYLPLFISILGLVVFFAAKTNAELKEAGRLAFAIGLLAFLLTGAPHLFQVIR